MASYKAGIYKEIAPITFPWTSIATSTGTMTTAMRNVGMAATAATTTWQQWIGQSYTITATSGDVWTTWNEWHEPIMYQYIQDEEELQRRADEQQRWREEQSRRRLAEQTRMQGAQDRALILLDEVVAAEDRFEELQLIQLLGSDGELYRIEMHRDSVHGNIVRVDEHGCILGRACVAPRMYDSEAGLALPLADGWVGQYLGLKYDAVNFLRVANWSGRRGCQQPQPAPELRIAA